MLVRAWVLVPWLAVALPAQAGPASPPPPPAAGDPTTTPPKAPKSAPPSPAPTTPPSPGGSGSGDGTPRPSGGALPPPPPGKPAEDTKAFEEPEGPPVDLSETWTYSRGRTEQPRFVRRADDRIESPNPAGYYSGVSVEGNHVPPFPATKMGSKPALLTWTGFERTSSGSRVFFEVSATVATKLVVKGSTLTLRITNTKINVRNNARSLDLRYFRTPVSSVKVKRSGKDAVATIVLKRGAEPRLHVVEGKSGYKLLVVEFADAASDAPAPAPPP